MRATEELWKHLDAHRKVAQCHGCAQLPKLSDDYRMALIEITDEADKILGVVLKQSCTYSFEEQEACADVEILWP